MYNYYLLKVDTSNPDNEWGILSFLSDLHTFSPPLSVGVNGRDFCDVTLVFIDSRSLFVPM